MSVQSDDVFQPAQARVGVILRGKWRLDRLLGVGGTACVYAATHRNGKRGAVKLLRAELAVDEEARHRFLREGYVANRIGHPGAVSVLDDDVTEDGAVFLVMELLEGQTLEDHARAQPRMQIHPSEVARIAEKLLDVLVAAHDKGIVHRDLKPENVFLTTTGDVKVLDFGIARMRDGPSAGRATEVGSIMGTPAFMPPEQALGNTAEIEARTDLWALGAVMFYVLSGRLIHEAETVNKVLLSAMTRRAPPIGTIVSGLPAELCAIVDRALAFEKQARFPDARSMQRALRSAMQRLPPPRPFVMGPAAIGAANRGHDAFVTSVLPASNARPSPTRTGPRIAFAVVLVAALLGGVLLVVFTARRSLPSERASAPSEPPAEAIVPPEPASLPEPVAVPPASAESPPRAAEIAPAVSSAPISTATPPITTTKGAYSRPPAKSATKPGSGGSKDIFSQW